MKIVVIGGTGLIGSKTVTILRQRGHQVVAASPQSGVNTLTGEGLDDALVGAQVVVDLANSPSFEDKAVLEFFKTSEGNLLPAEEAAGVRHHVALSIVAIDQDRQRLFPRQGRPGEIDRSFGHSVHDRAVDPVHGISPRHRQFERLRKHSQASARAVSAHRGG